MSAARSGAPVRSAGVRRLLQEAQELERDESTDYAAAPLEDDIFSWHFTVRGPKSSDFEGGVYHGRLVLPSEYPFKPPEVYMLTPSGRFEINKKICLSISSFHPETWQPSWGIRTALVALMAFFESEAKGAVGSLDAPPAERQRMARNSHQFKCHTCGFEPANPDSFAALTEPVVAAEKEVEATAPVQVKLTAPTNSADQAVAIAASPEPDPPAPVPASMPRKAPPSSIETTIFPASTPTVRSPSAARHAREPQTPLDHNPFASPYHHHHHHHHHPHVERVPAGSPSFDGATNAGTAYVPPGAPRLSPAHLPATTTRNPSFTPSSAPPNPLRTPDLLANVDVNGADTNPLEQASTSTPSGSSTSTAVPPPPSQSQQPRESTPIQHPQVQLPALPPGVSLAQISHNGAGGIGGGPPSWVDRAIVACLLALVALVVRKIA
ncbi:hypothetical protein JCM10908_004434 [Rhodotorula pacifica]|uniref:ubiquitin-conjugating enzyme E2 n=1 Tax=Rhodotorula pacifica TaxID=1495444 RepID=UPI003180472C